MADSKEKAVIDFLCTCPAIQSNPLFFNFINAKSDNKQIVTASNDRNINRPYIDGSVLKRYSFTLIDYRSVSYQAIVKSQIDANENVQEYVDIQDIIDWVNEQEEARIYPDFGNKCQIEEMRVVTDNPVLNGVDTQLKPALAKYSFTIQIDYIDNSKVITN